MRAVDLFHDKSAQRTNNYMAKIYENNYYESDT